MDRWMGGLGCQKLRGPGDLFFFFFFFISQSTYVCMYVCMNECMYVSTWAHLRELYHFSSHCTYFLLCCCNVNRYVTVEDGMAWLGKKKKKKKKNKIKKGDYLRQISRWIYGGMAYDTVTLLGYI